MYEMPQIPKDTDIVKGDLQGRGEGVTGVMSGRNKISLHQGSLLGLQNHLDGVYPGMRVAFASSADTPFAEKVGRAALKLLEVVPGTTVWDLVVGRDWEGQDVNQIGRQPPLSSNKARSHFPALKKLTGIRYDRMLFFDDCNWCVIEKTTLCLVSVHGCLFAWRNLIIVVFHLQGRSLWHGG